MDPLIEQFGIVDPLHKQEKIVILQEQVAQLWKSCETLEAENEYLRDSVRELKVLGGE